MGMKPVHESDVSDVASLRMENDLLIQEVRHLRGRVAAAERALKNHDARIQAAVKVAVREANAKTATARANARKARMARREAAERARTYRQADRDMRRLVRRLNTSPLGPLLRRRAGFRTLVDRYGGEPGAA
jgi:hypothetical protein